MKTSIISPNLSGCVSILDCGVTYLATYVNEKTDHEATIWDYTFNKHNWKNYVTDKFNKDKPDNTYRIITVGGSTTFGAGVTDENTWPRILEKKLQNISESKNIEINSH